MIAPRENYGITRIDQQEKSNHGYWVRLRHAGKKRQRYFPDKSSGGKGQALKLAKEYRDGVLQSFGREKQELAARPKREVLKSGVVGVHHVQSRTISPKTKKEVVYDYWQASWEDEEGRRRTAKFSILRLGKEEALEMAKKARRKAIRAISSRKNKAARN